MMNHDEGRFEKIPDHYFQKDVTPAFVEAMVKQDFGMATLHLGEIVEIKGVKFEVREMRSRGRLALKMLKAGA